MQLVRIFWVNQTGPVLSSRLEPAPDLEQLLGLEQILGLVQQSTCETDYLLTLQVDQIIHKLYLQVLRELI